MDKLIEEIEVLRLKVLKEREKVESAHLGNALSGLAQAKDNLRWFCDGQAKAAEPAAEPVKPK